MRLIDADALMGMDIKIGHIGEKTVRAIQWATVYAFYRNIGKSPTVDAVPVVRGEWIEKTYIHEYANEETEERQYVVCGICGKQPPSGFGAVNFCHNCGADMRRESEGST